VRYLAAVFALLVVAPGARVLVAQGAADSLSAHAPRVVVGRLSGAIQLDGILDEPAWAEASPAPLLTQRDPDEGAAPTERTEIRVLLGADALYVGARLFDTDPARIRALLTRRDAASESSCSR
jgi:hypothetical protein